MFKTVCVHLEMGELRRARFRDVHAAGATLITLKSEMD
jgi:hypothetical protein